MREFTLRLFLNSGKTADQKIVEFHGPSDITKETTDAIVNAANSSLLGGGGVDGAIHRAGGPAILAECKRIVGEIGHLPAGKAVITTGGRLPASYVIHTVGPVYRHDRNVAQTLASCYRECLRVADEHGVSSLSFPAISTGAYGYPLSEAAPIAMTTILNTLDSTAHVNLVRFVLFDGEALKKYLAAAQKLRDPNTNHPYRSERGPQ
ncbi:MAG TPA: O-acetyl-ADP-ribose deacetylase [Terriglobales bacterium]